MSNKFTYHPTSQKPPPVCKKSIPDALLSYQCPPDLMQALATWEDPSLGDGFTAGGTAPFDQYGGPGEYTATIGDKNADHIEANLYMENGCEDYFLLLTAYGGEAFLDFAFQQSTQWRKTKPWDTGLKTIEPGGGGQTPRFRATS